MGACSKYGIARDVEFEATAAATIAGVWLSFTIGLLFHAFKFATDKHSLRDSVVSSLDILAKRGIEQTRLPPALRTWAEQARHYKVVV